MAAMNLPKKAEMASAKKRVHVSHETVIEDVSTSKPSSEAPPKSAVEEFQQRPMAAMNTPQEGRDGEC